VRAARRITLAVLLLCWPGVTILRHAGAPEPTLDPGVLAEIRAVGGAGGGDAIQALAQGCMADAPEQVALLGQAIEQAARHASIDDAASGWPRLRLEFTSVADALVRETR
jgi:hypothetical protein